MDGRAAVVVVGLGGLHLACAGLVPGSTCTPDSITEGDSCWIERDCMIAGHEDDCGLNGFRCEDGEWQELMTYCNPPPLPFDEDGEPYDG